jgi:hypothetical protein
MMMRCLKNKTILGIPVKSPAIPENIINKYNLSSYFASDAKVKN